MEDYIEKIDRLRAERGWTRYRLAMEAKLPPRTVYNWFSRKVEPSVAALRRVCRALGLQMWQLFYNEK